MYIDIWFSTSQLPQLQFLCEMGMVCIGDVCVCMSPLQEEVSKSFKSPECSYFKTFSHDKQDYTRCAKYIFVINLHSMKRVVKSLKYYLQKENKGNFSLNVSLKKMEYLVCKSRIFEAQSSNIIIKITEQNGQFQP